MTPASIAAKLTEAQRRFLLNASKSPKRWSAIRRHAKLEAEQRVHAMYVPLGLIHPVDGTRDFALTSKGLAVRAILQETEREG